MKLRVTENSEEREVWLEVRKSEVLSISSGRSTGCRNSIQDERAQKICHGKTFLMLKYQGPELNTLNPCVKCSVTC